MHHVFCKPGPSIIQISSNRLLQLCQKNLHFRGFVNLSGYVGKTFLEKRIRKSAKLQVQKKNFVSSITGRSSDGTAHHNVLSKKQAKELAVKLTPEERDVLISALQECQSMKLKAEYEGQLAAFQWRNKFGRPSIVPSLGTVDPTGSYCEVPDDWLLRKYAETVPRPNRRELIQVFISNAIPYILFGFFDNFIMIIAGDQIEVGLGSIMVLSTMAAAAIGNTLSDIAGIGIASCSDNLITKIGFTQPELTPIQMNMRITKFFLKSGRIVGVTVGCIIGMSPLLFLRHDDEKKEAEKKISEKIELIAVD